MTNDNNKPIALALSGGGVRAMAFHLGVLKYLAEKNCLERVKRLSTVSGGSLVAGLIYKEAGMNWPSSDQYLSDIYPALTRKICSRNMQFRAFSRLLNPLNLRFALSRANLLSIELRKGWGINEMLSDLPESPEWSINGTTAENGKRFRFKRETLGDYKLGYASARKFPLSDALAVSAAFPGGIGPLTVDATALDWKRRSSWDATEKPMPVEPDYKRIRLYDGGVYDNLGLEPFFDAGSMKPKHEGEMIIVSDAGAPLSQGFPHFSMSPWRIKRVLDIISDQSRALRVRTFVNYIQQNRLSGSYLYIDTPVSGLSHCKSREIASAFPTTLRSLNEQEFSVLAGHGYKVADAVDQEYAITGSDTS